jgi:hypothetical protein
MIAAFSALVVIGAVCFASLSLAAGSLSEVSQTPIELDDPIDPLFSQPVIAAPPTDCDELCEIQGPVTAVPPIGYIDMDEYTQNSIDQFSTHTVVTCRVYICPMHPISP